MNLNFAARDTFPEHWSLKKTFHNKDPRVHPLISERKAYRTLYAEFMSSENKRQLNGVLERMTKKKFNTDSMIFDQEMLRIYMEKAWSESADVTDLIHKRRKQMVRPQPATIATGNKGRSILSSFLYGDSGEANNNDQKKSQYTLPSLLRDLNGTVISHFSRKLKKYKKAGLSYYVDHVEKSSDNLSPPERPSLSTAIRTVGPGDSFSLADLRRRSNANNRKEEDEKDAVYDRMKYTNQMTEHPLASNVPMNQLEYIHFIQNVREDPVKRMTEHSAVYR